MSLLKVFASILPTLIVPSPKMHLSLHLLSLLPFVSARRGIWNLPADTQAATTYSNATFSQLIDHSDPSLGTFEQFYYYDTTYWKGPGSPVVLFTPGEINVTGYQSYLGLNRTTGAFDVILEQWACYKGEC
jgi:hypothetical protein